MIVDRATGIFTDRPGDPRKDVQFVMAIDNPDGDGWRLTEGGEVTECIWEDGRQTWRLWERPTKF